MNKGEELRNSWWITSPNEKYSLQLTENGYLLFNKIDKVLDQIWQSDKIGGKIFQIQYFSDYPCTCELLSTERLVRVILRYFSHRFYMVSTLYPKKS